MDAGRLLAIAMVLRARVGDVRKRVFALLAVLALLGATGGTPAAASPREHYSGPHFGADSFPPGCIRDMSRDNPRNICHHMRTGLNALDSPQVDVLVMVPASPTAERDMRIMRQSVEMWEGGLDYLAGEMGLDWLASGLRFHITVDSFEPQGGGGGEFTTYPIVDPEIVVIATNPVGGAGIGIDPVDLVFTDEDLVPCHDVENPFDFEYWENLPGFDDHHRERTGTYVEDCGGAGGNVCFAINGAIDPVPEHLDVFNLFDLVSHEFGHCLTLGHVGDGREGEWGVVPTNDIMAYSSDPPDRNKCVSTLDVEGVAIRMSRYLDVDGDGRVDETDRLLANDQAGEGGDPFQIQHPDDHLYASGSGSPLDCPQPDVGLVPGPRTDWTPTPVPSTRPQLTVTAPEDGARSTDGAFDVTGTVERIAIGRPPTPTGSHDDADGDTVGVAGGHAKRPAEASVADLAAEPVTFERPGGNTFYPEESSFGTTSGFSHHFRLDVPVASRVEFELTWTEDVAGTDLDLYVTGAADSGEAGATLNPSERVVFADVQGRLDIEVDPFLVTDPSGVTYMLTATVAADTDRDGISDSSDRCPAAPGGCPIGSTEHVRVYVDEVPAASELVDTAGGPDAFDIPVRVAPGGTHEVRVEWEDRGDVLAATSRTVVVDGNAHVGASQGTLGADERGGSPAPAAGSGADRDCSDFDDQAQAQRHLTSGDPHRLDRDSDGVACEGLPCPCSRAARIDRSDRREADRSSRGRRARETFGARISSVVDGDTVRVKRLIAHRHSRGARHVHKRWYTIRLIGIDAPGDKRPGAPGECGARAATSHALELGFTRPEDLDADGLFDRRGGTGRAVWVRTDPTQGRHDRHGRLLAYLTTRHRPRNLALEQLRAGWARTSVRRGNRFGQYLRFKDAERRARRDGRGVWKLCGGDFHRPATG